MPACDSRPNGPYPNKRVDSSDHPSQGELMLCSACEIIAFITWHRTRQTIAVLHVKLLNRATVHDNTAGLSDTPIDNKNVLVVCELCYFVGNTMDKHPLSTIKSVISEFYRHDEIMSAKQKLISVLPEAVKGSSWSQFIKKMYWHQQD